MADIGQDGRLEEVTAESLRLRPPAAEQESSAFADRGIPALLSGFAGDTDGAHGPDESFRLESLRLGERAAEELYLALAALS